MKQIKRLFDTALAAVLLVIFILPMLGIAALIKFTSYGPVLYWTDRVGINNTIFKMAKFRTMKINTPPLATHLMKDVDHYVTSIGSVLRKTSLDELPQLFNILRGEMSFVGPRPALYNQDDLINLRTKKGIHALTPGLTGWAQIHGRDDLPIPIKVQYDEYYLIHRSFRLDLRIIWKTIFKTIKAEGVIH